MRGVLGMTELLQRTELNTTQLHYEQTVARSGQALLSIVNDIPDFSKIDARRLELEEIDLGLASLLRDVPAVMRTDALRLRQVLMFV